MLIFLALFLLVGINICKANSENISNKKKALYFYQETCEYCQAAEKYFQENGIYEKYDIEKIEISGAYNLSYFNEFFDAFGVPPEKRGWPVIFFGTKFLAGYRPIQENFTVEIEKTNADNFPRPEIIKKYRLANANFIEENSTHANISWLILFGAALADSVSPCVLAIFVILASIIIFGNPENKKEILIFGTFFILSLLLVYFSLGVKMLSSGEIFRLSGIPSKLFGLFVVAAGLFVLRKYWQKAKIIKTTSAKIKHLVSVNFGGIFEKIWNFIKKNIQKMNLAVAAIMIGFISSGFLFPCANKPYGIFAKSFFGKENMFSGIPMIALYNLIFIFPIVLFSGAIYWFAHTKKLEIFRSKNDKLIRIIMGIGLLFAGGYFIYNSCF